MATKSTQNKIILQNFASMYPEIPQYSVKNQHYLLGNVDPFYYLYSQDSQIHEKQYAPLVAAKQVTTVQTGLDVSNYGDGVIALIQDITNYNTLYLTTDNQHTYAWRSGYLTDLGKPSGATGSNTMAALAIYNGNLIATYGNNTTTGYRNPISGLMSSSTWVSISGVLRGWLVPFLQYCFSGASDVSQINRMNSSWVSGSILDLGGSWGIPKAVNWNNKYLAFVGQQNQNNNNTNYLFLWDGISKTYNYSTIIPGTYRDILAHSDGNLYVAVSNGGIQQLLVLSGFKLKPVFDFPLYENVNNFYWKGTISKMFSFGKYIGILFQSGGKDQYSFILLYDPVKKSKYIIYSHAYSTIADNLTNALGISHNMYIALADGNLYNYSIYNNSYAPINYVSQNIPLNGTIDSVEVYYDSPPTGSATINVSIVSSDEDTGDTTTNLSQITSSNYLNKNKTILDAGIKCNWFKLILYTFNFSKIRKIVVNYTSFI